MSKISENAKIPSATFKVVRDGDFHDVTTNDVFAGKTVVVFGLPGAFTPVCSGSQVPGYVKAKEEFTKAGVDTIACLSVNDSFVMNAWQKAQNAEELVMLPDGNAEFTKGLGLGLNFEELGFGERCTRFSMLVKDGTVVKIFEEEDPSVLVTSDADTMLEYLAA